MHLPGLVTITITPEPEEVKSKGITATTLSGQGCTFMVSCLQTAKPTLLGDFPSKFVWKASPPTNPPHSHWVCSPSFAGGGTPAATHRPWWPISSQRHVLTRPCFSKFWEALIRGEEACSRP